MSEPTLLVEVAFGSDPGAVTPTYTDITNYVEFISITRGRQRERDRFESGRCTVRCANRDRRFDPNYTSGPYYPNVLPMRRLRVTATWAGFPYRLFSGWIDGYPQGYPHIYNGICEIRATDGFKLLKKPKLRKRFLAETAGERIVNVLDAIGWPGATLYGSAGNRSISTNGSTLQSSDLDNGSGGTSALEHLYHVELSDSGRLFFSGDGALTYINHAIFLTTALYNTSQATFGDDTSSGELPYVDIGAGYDDEQLWNQVEVSIAGGTDGTSAVVTMAGTASANATSLSVEPLELPDTMSDIPAGATLVFGPGKIATLQAKAEDGDTIIEVFAIPLSIPGGDEAVYIQGLQVAADSASQVRYMDNVLPAGNLLLSDNRDALDLAYYLLSRYKSPTFRLPQLSFKPASYDALWPVLLGQDLGYRNTVKKRVKNLDGTTIGDPIVQQVQTENIAWTIDRQKLTWLAKLGVSLADPNTYWMLGSPTFGILASTSRLAF